MLTSNSSYAERGSNRSPLSNYHKRIKNLHDFQHKFKYSNLKNVQMRKLLQDVKGDQKTMLNARMY